MTLKWKKYHPLSDQNAFICLVNSMGDDSSIVQAARVSYGKDEQTEKGHILYKDTDKDAPQSIKDSNGDVVLGMCKKCGAAEIQLDQYPCTNDLSKADRQLIRYLMNHSHTTPFEMVEIKFMVQVPMDCWRQWIRHRTANVNEYSTRYTEAIDACQTTLPGEWRLQATDNKQGSSGFLEEWPEGVKFERDPKEEVSVVNRTGYVATIGEDEVWGVNPNRNPGEFLSHRERRLHSDARIIYEERLALGVAKEQARKDLPLSTYTRAYWKCDLHNIFNFLRLRMDSHAQLEIRQFANCMFEIVKQICPVACEAFEDYVLNAKKFSRMEMDFLKYKLNFTQDLSKDVKPDSITDREWKEFEEKLQ